MPDVRTTVYMFIQSYWLAFTDLCSSKPLSLSISSRSMTTFVPLPQLQKIWWWGKHWLWPQCLMARAKYRSWLTIHEWVTEGYAIAKSFVTYRECQLLPLQWIIMSVSDALPRNVSLYKEPAMRLVSPAAFMRSSRWPLSIYHCRSSCLKSNQHYVTVEHSSFTGSLLIHYMSEFMCCIRMCCILKFFPFIHCMWWDNNCYLVS